MAKQTLKQSLHLATTGKSKDMERALWALEAKPHGGWGETVQARSFLVECLPGKDNRSYTADEFIDEAYDIVGGYFRVKSELRGVEHWLALREDTEHYAWVMSVHSSEASADKTVEDAMRYLRNHRGDAQNIYFVHALPSGSYVPAVGERIRYC